MTTMTKKSQESLGLGDTKKSGPVECLGQTFASDEARREHYLKLLAEKLKDPEFRKTPGFPTGSDHDILGLSDPPYYTACPNPFLVEFVQFHGRPFDSSEDYRRKPFCVDVSEGRTDQLYRAHSYHTKVPHLAIVPSVLHYTRPGDLILDGFCGSGMTGVAAQWCGTSSEEYRRTLEHRWNLDGLGKPEWGARRVLLGDLGPAATFIAANYNLPFDRKAFETSARELLKSIESDVGWMYETRHTDGRKGVINYTVWSEVFSCPQCSGDVTFVEEALDKETKRVHAEFPCPMCGIALTKDNLERTFETGVDPATRGSWKRIRLKPVLINYSLGKSRYEKVPAEHDGEVLLRIGTLPFPPEIPTNPFPIEKMYHGSRLAPKGFTHTHHLFLPRAAQSLAAMWRRANAESDTRLRNMMLFFVEQAIWGMSVLSRYAPTHFSQVNQYLNGVYYVGSQIAEVSPWYILEGKLKRLGKAFSDMGVRHEHSLITTGDCGTLTIPDNTIDYIFTDPPFGENIYYADLNFLVETWHRVVTSAANEAIVDQAKKKGVNEYQELMRRCFEEYHRTLKPGRWMTVVFSNSSNAIWKAIQEAIGVAGFVVADVRTLDRKAKAFKAAIGQALFRDLIISCYKPTEELTQQFSLGAATTDSAWAFVREHLRNVPVFVSSGDHAETVTERTPQMLHDRMIAFFVRRGVAVPISGPDFFSGLNARYPRRDGMYFLPDQVSEYDRKRISVRELRQLDLLVSDEASATQWVRQQLERKPQSYQDLSPQFMQHLHAWAKHEKTIELKEILTLNFLCYDGTAPVPTQIHSYLSTNFKDMRNLDKDEATLKAKARDRWYVPDPSKEGDLEKLRIRTLLKEFEDYRSSTSRKLQQFRTEAVRAGFKQCYDSQDYETIVDVAARLPEEVIQEDEKLLMYLDVATMRLGKE